jgi:bifunctional non-homologous end joining protein LigD
MAVRLEEYYQKRNFTKTPEPSGEEEPNPEAEPQGLRFVVQHHMARREHYDLRLEWRGALLSWAVPKGPSYHTRDKRLAIQVEDHPLEYRNFEGTIPKGEYGGGTVMLWDEGYWEPQNNVEEGLRSGSLKLVLKGRRLKGKWALVRMKAKAGESADNWLLLKEKDQYAREDDGISQFTTSIRTGRTMEEIEEGAEEKFTRNPFRQTGVQLAKLVKDIPQGDGWLYEVKYDGYRMVAYVEGNGVRLISRGGNDYTGHFQPVADALVDWAAGRAMVLDGEMVVTDPQGRTDFQALQNYLRKPRPQHLAYIVFDLLALDGEDLRSQPLTQRKETLEALMQGTPNYLHYSRHTIGNGEASFCAACQLNLEGIIGKKADSIYSGTRNGDWIKLKCDKRQEFVIGGYTRQKADRIISSLLLGIYQDGELIYAGRAGTGLSQRDMKQLMEKFEGIQRAQSPFLTAPKARANESITWLEPHLVAEVKFAEWTEEHLLRQASYQGLREDKNPKEVKKEGADVPAQPASSAQEREKPMDTKGDNILVEGIKISSPDKVIFNHPKITKADVARYYAKVAERMLPYVSHRILSIVRCPKGVSQSCFYKKHPGSSSREVVTIPITNSDGETEDYFYIESRAGLISEAQMGTLEFHVWGSRVEHLEQPDMMVFDLDPDEGMALDLVRQGVRDLQSILAELSLISYLKTSGGKGYHVVVPLTPSASWDAFSDFAKRIAQVMEQKWPDRYTSNMRKSKRTNKIFIDWVRNGRGATSVAPYSIRAREGATVSMPIGWDELDTVEPDGIHMEDALLRIGGADPWEGFFTHQQQLK